MDDLLVNFFYAHPVGHVIEALYYANGHHAAGPGRRVSVALNAAAPTELAGWCPSIATVHPIRHPFLDAGPASYSDDMPREWDCICDDFRRHQAIQLEMFPGMRDYYATSDARLHARERRTVVGDSRVGYVPHTPLRLDLPERARDAARSTSDRPRIALLPAGSSEPSLYPSADSWLLVVDALTRAIDGLQIVLVGRSAAGERTATSLDDGDRRRLLDHPSRPVDGFDRPIAEQLALVETCGAFLSPHTGFGMAALAVATPWLTLSGGRWFEYFFNHVPFRSIIPEPDRFPVFTQFDPAAVVTDRDGTARTPTMTRARVESDLDRIVAAAVELVDGSLGYDRALAEYFPALLAAHGGDDSAIWSIDRIHERFL
ncbi:hypothetical protein [Pseudonocardia endophytica]|uniref:ADP-heptose:LPS heptosyltransferase n=1 Tax=Pseudonocardia endophytica TaxID=401976 RepID=A0A4R1HRM7_PSEEN|nr:hypothetical protein [Pseudonocardia endophytica]TCK20032.1 ADP-heptose:LPS heptosyltransferase [Pseudonocardia endophytica]